MYKSLPVSKVNLALRAKVSLAGNMAFIDLFVMVFVDCAADARLIFV